MMRTYIRKDIKFYFKKQGRILEDLALCFIYPVKDLN